MAQKSMSMSEMEHNKHRMWHGAKKLLLGLIVLANVQWSFIGWWTLVGVLLVIMGLSKMIMPGCDCHHH